MAFSLDINFLFKTYYSDNPELELIVTTHSEMVAKKALEIAREKNLYLDPRDIYAASMLHDIGVVKCNAPGIFARGNLPYLLHGIEGEKILKNHGLFTYAGVCSNHTGAGITKEEIIKRGLPLPAKDFIAQNLLEELICYSDKFYSKGRDLRKEKSLEEVEKEMKKFGEGPWERFKKMHIKFS